MKVVSGPKHAQEMQRWQATIHIMQVDLLAGIVISLSLNLLKIYIMGSAEDYLLPSSTKERLFTVRKVC